MRGRVGSGAGGAQLCGRFDPLLSDGQSAPPPVEQPARPGESRGGRGDKAAIQSQHGVHSLGHCWLWHQKQRSPELHVLWEGVASHLHSVGRGGAGRGEMAHISFVPCRFLGVRQAASAPCPPACGVVCAWVGGGWFRARSSWVCQPASALLVVFFQSCITAGDGVGFKSEQLILNTQRSARTPFPPASQASFTSPSQAAEH